MPCNIIGRQIGAYTLQILCSKLFIFGRKSKYSYQKYFRRKVKILMTPIKFKSLWQLFFSFDKLWSTYQNCIFPLVISWPRLLNQKVKKKRIEKSNISYFLYEEYLNEVYKSFEGVQITFLGTSGFSLKPKLSKAKWGL